MRSRAPFSIDDLKKRARKRLPRAIFDFVEGGCDDERAVGRGEAAWKALKFLPRVLVGANNRSQKQTVLGYKFSVPFGIAPLGLADFVWPGTESAFARLSASYRMPFVASSAGVTPLEELRKVGGPNTWLQVYVGADREADRDLLRRAEAAGYSAIIITVDAPVVAKRTRDLRNRLAVPSSVSFILKNLPLHFFWALANLNDDEKASLLSKVGRRHSTLQLLQADQFCAALNWHSIDEIRQLWSGKLLLKGILDPRDASHAADIGVDGVIVSNHGGRQLDSSPTTTDALRHIARTVGDRMSVIVDGGIRSGEDVAKAMVLGADLVLMGRPFLYGAAALGPERGIARVFSLIVDDMDRVQAQIGCESMEDLRRNARLQETWERGCHDMEFPSTGW